jgi:iron complex outermembrane receptor protein
LLWLGFASAAYAQDATPAADAAEQPTAAETQAADAQEDTADENNITVMARRRAESVLETPLAVTALGPQTLTQQSVVSFQDLNRAAPNVILRVTNSGGGTVDAVIRGQSIPLSNIAVDAPVGFYLDDVIMAQPKGVAVGLFDLQSVEVSRGVQGTLRGRNNTGGAISIYTHRPELGVLNGEATLGYGSRNYLRMQGIVNVPIGDTLAVRAGFQRITQDGYGRSIVTNQAFGGQHQWIGRLSALFQPSEDFSLHIAYDHVDIDQSPLGRRALPGSQVYNALISGTGGATNASSLLLTPSQIIPADFWDGSTNYVMENDVANVDFWRATLSYRLSNAVNLKVIGGYRDLIALGGIDLDGSPALNNESRNGGSSHQWTIESQLYGDLADNLSYIVGYYHFNDRGKLIANTRPWVFRANAPTTPFRNLSIIREEAENTSDAVYGHVEFNPTPALELAAGLRYTWDQRHVTPNRLQDNAEPTGSTLALFQAGTIQRYGCQFTTAVNGVQRPAGGFVIVNGAAVASGLCPVVNFDADFSYLSYELSARYEINDNLSAYARHGLGQKSGVINIPIVSMDTPVITRPERVRDYEVGLKGEDLFGGGFNFSLALYYSDYRNLQRNIGTLLPGGTQPAAAVVNAGRARVQGIEFEANWRVTDRFRISGFMGITDAKYIDFQAIGAGGVVFDLTDQPFLATPKFSSRLGATYDIPLANGRLRLGAGWNHQSNTSYQVIFFEGAESGVVDLVDARISWTSADNRFEIAAWATNLLNEEYLTAAQANRSGVSSANSAVATAYGTQGDPRFFGISGTVRFGQH